MLTVHGALDLEDIPPLEYPVWTGLDSLQTTTPEEGENQVSHE